MGRNNGNNWTEEMRKFLKRYYSFLPMDELMDELGRSEQAIRGQAWLMKLKRYPLSLRNVLLGRNDFKDVRER